MPDYPRTLSEFQQRFPDDDACAAWLAELRWPDGFRCAKCDHDAAWRLKTKAWTFECRKCGHQTSVKAGTIMHRSKLPLTVWFWAAWLMATHSNGISAMQLKKQFGLRYESAWLLCAKLRRAMVDPARNPLKGLVEIDETTMRYRTKEDPPAGGQGRSHEGKMLIAGAVEFVAEGSRRLRLCAIEDYSADTLHDFIAKNVAPGTAAHTDGLTSYKGAPGVAHEPHIVGLMAAHILLPCIHRVFSNLKTWALGVYHGLRKKHLQSYLDEFVFRYNRRHSRPAGFRSLLRIAMCKQPVTYKMLTQPETTG